MEDTERTKLEAEERKLVRKLRQMGGDNWETQATNAKACGLQHRLWLVRSLLAPEGAGQLAAAKTAQGWADAHHRARKGDADRVLEALHDATRSRTVAEGLELLKPR